MFADKLSFYASLSTAMENKQHLDCEIIAVEQVKHGKSSKYTDFQIISPTALSVTYPVLIILTTEMIVTYHPHYHGLVTFLSTIYRYITPTGERESPKGHSYKIARK